MHDANFQLSLSKFFYNDSQRFFYPCFYLNEVSSTQDALKKILLQGAPNKTTVFTYKQTQGRGRNQSQWQTLPGQHLFFSHAHNFKIPTKDVAKLSLLIGMTLRNSLERHFNIRAKVKWPNDLYIDNKKLSGILCETFQLARRQIFIIGIGINVTINDSNISFGKLTPAFAQEHSSKNIHRWELLGKILHDIDESFINIEESFLKLHQDYIKYDYLFNKKISVNTGQKTLRGQAKGIGKDGALLLELNNSTLISVYSGHIDLYK